MHAHGACCCCVASQATYSVLAGMHAGRQAAEPEIWHDAEPDLQPQQQGQAAPRQQRPRRVQWAGGYRAALLVAVVLGLLMCHSPHTLQVHAMKVRAHAVAKSCIGTVFHHLSKSRGSWGSRYCSLVVVPLLVQAPQTAAVGTCGPTRARPLSSVPD